MGHNEYGRLPRSQEWAAVVALLEGPGTDANLLAGMVVQAAQRRLLRLQGEQALGFCFWLLVRIAVAAREPGFTDQLALLGLRVLPQTTPRSFITEVAERTESYLEAIAPSGHFGELAALSLRYALTEALGTRPAGLLQDGAGDLRQLLREYATDGRFAELAHAFFGDFLARALQAIVDRELATCIGETRAFATLGDSLTFLQSLDIHARQSAQVMQEFVVGWYAKQRRERVTVTLPMAEAVVAHVLEKLSGEMTYQAVGA